MMLPNKNDTTKELDKSKENDVAGFTPVNGEVYRTPYFNLEEEENRYIVSIEIPGSQQDSIEIKTENGVLLVTAFLAKEENSTTTKHLHSDRHGNRYQHDETLPIDANTKSLKYEYKDGLLIITMDKMHGVDSDLKESTNSMHL